jgi:hypothetical protein
MNNVWSMPILKRVTTERPASVAHPVGFDDVAPAPLPFHPETKESNIRRGLSGNGRNSPTAGTPDPKKVRLPIKIATITAIHAMTGAVALSRQRRTSVSAPM